MNIRAFSEDEFSEMISLQKRIAAVTREPVRAIAWSFIERVERGEIENSPSAILEAMRSELAYAKP